MRIKALKSYSDPRQNSWRVSIANVENVALRQNFSTGLNCLLERSAFRSQKSTLIENDVFLLLIGFEIEISIFIT